jgi:hypothetical protein
MNADVSHLLPEEKRVKPLAGIQTFPSSSCVIQHARVLIILEHELYLGSLIFLAPIIASHIPSCNEDRLTTFSLTHPIGSHIDPDENFCPAEAGTQY